MTKTTTTTADELPRRPSPLDRFKLGLLPELAKVVPVAGDRLVLLALLYHAGKSWPNCNPSVATLARETGSCERTIQAATQRLERAGVLVVERSIGRSSNRYRITLEPRSGCGVEDGLNPAAVTGLGETNPAAVTGLNPAAVVTNPAAVVTQPRSGCALTGIEREENGNTHTEGECVSPLDNSEPSAPSAPDTEGDGFTDLWKLYPKKERETAARTEWLKLTADDRAAALEALPALVEWWSTQKEFPRYVPQPHKWIAERRWTDQPPRTHPDLRDYDRLMGDEYPPEARARDAADNAAANPRPLPAPAPPPPLTYDHDAGRWPDPPGWVRGNALAKDALRAWTLDTDRADHPQVWHTQEHPGRDMPNLGEGYPAPETGPTSGEEVAP